MAAVDDVASVVAELNKLRKSKLIDIITTQKLPVNVNSELLTDFMTKLSEKLSESEVFHDVSNNLTPSRCENETCAKQTTKAQTLHDELIMIQRLLGHLEKRVQEQEEIIFLLKQMNNFDQFKQMVPSVSNQLNSETNRKAIINTQKSDKPTTPQKTQIAITKSQTIQQKRTITGTQVKTAVNSAMTSTKINNKHRDREPITRLNSTKSQAKTIDILGTMNETNEENRPKYQQHQFRKKNNIICKGSASTDDENLEGVDGKAWVYAGRGRPNGSADKIQTFLTAKFPNKQFSVEEIAKHSLNKSKNKSYKISFDMDILEEMSKSETWPKGLVIKRYQFFREVRYS